MRFYNYINIIIIISTLQAGNLRESTQNRDFNCLVNNCLMFTLINGTEQHKMLIIGTEQRENTA